MAGTYFSEILYSGPISSDFIEIAVPAGTDTTGWKVAFYNFTGDMTVEVDVGAPVATIVGQDVYVIEQGTPNFPSFNSGFSLALVDGTGSVLQFLALHASPATANNGPAAGMTPTYAGVTAASGESIQSTDDGASYQIETAPNSGTIPCFGPGSFVLSPEGWRLVETLRPGDRVVTLDQGPQPVIWVHCLTVDCANNPDLRPIELRVGALGNKAPFERLVLSGQHRILAVAHQFPARARTTEEPLVPVKALLGLAGVRSMRGRKTQTWHHFALPRHAVVQVNGVWTESLLLGPEVMRGLPRIEQLRLRALFPRAALDQRPLNGPPARPILTPRQTASLIGSGGGRRGQPIRTV